MREYIIDFVQKEARKYREAAKIEQETFVKKTDLKTAEIFDLIGEMLKDYLLEENRDWSSILERCKGAKGDQFEEAS